MRENGGGVIVNTSSTSSLIGNFGQTNYGAAKGGIWGLSNVLAVESRKYNIRIWPSAPDALTRMTADLPRYKENPGAALGPDGIAPAVLNAPGSGVFITSVVAPIGPTPGICARRRLQALARCQASSLISIAFSSTCNCG